MDVCARGLKAAAKYFGFAPEGRTYIAGSEISRVWREDPKRALADALDDVIETERLARHLVLRDLRSLRGGRLVVRLDPALAQP